MQPAQPQKEGAAAAEAQQPKPERKPFDFDGHAARALEQYEKRRPLYEDFARSVSDILRESLAAADIKVASIEQRAKAPESFRRKAALPSLENPDAPRYSNPLVDLTDLAGVRVITFLLKTVESVDRVIAEQFEVREMTDKSEALWEEGRLGYQSVHFLVSLRPERTKLPEYRRYDGLISEIQVRTILQHAWAEIEHDIQYKSVETAPTLLRRRFTSLAGLLEIADREFQGIQDEDERFRKEARQSVQEGRLEDVEITADALKAYLDGLLGEDGRMKELSYESQAWILRSLGFENLRQLDDCLSHYDDDEVSRAIWGSRYGQLSRLEGMLLAAMGQEYIERHPWSRGRFAADWRRIFGEWLTRLKASGFEVGEHCPARAESGGPTDSEEQDSEET